MDHRYTRAGRSTVARWYALRHEQSEKLRHPERVITIDRINYYDQQAVKAFWAGHQEGVGTDRLGVSGRRSGPEGGGRGAGRPVSAERAQAVQIALAKLRRAGALSTRSGRAAGPAHGGAQARGNGPAPTPGPRTPPNSVRTARRSGRPYSRSRTSSSCSTGRLAAPATSPPSARSSATSR